MHPTLLTLPVLLAGFFSTSDTILRNFILACLFGAAAAFSLPALGGAPITPAIALLPFLLWRALREQGAQRLMRQLAYPGAGFWLAALTVWGVFSAIVLPRFFAGDTRVFANDRTDAMNAMGVITTYLGPVSTNYTQTAYLVAGLLCFTAVRAMLEGPSRVTLLRNAVLALAAANVGAALLNVGEVYGGLPSVLSLVRNAGYLMLIGADVGGLRRISGTFPEASVFAMFTLPLLAFCASLWADRVRGTYSGLLALALLALLLFSTSTTAYGALAVYAACITVAFIFQSIRRANLPAMRWGTVLAWLVAVVSCIVALMSPALVERVIDFFQVTVIRKLESSSGIERSSWNRQAIVNLIDTYGIGIGLGSARTSSFALVLLSNLGVLGVGLFGAFFLRVYSPAKGSVLEDPDLPPLQRAARRAVLAAFIAGSVGGGVFDLGLPFYAFAALACGSAAPRPASRAQSATSHPPHAQLAS